MSKKRCNVRSRALGETASACRRIRDDAHARGASVTRGEALSTAWSLFCVVVMLLGVIPMLLTVTGSAIAVYFTRV